MTAGTDMVWLAAIKWYLIATAIGHLAWETVQLPFYTLWQTGTARQIIFAVLHCTVGDVAIAAAALSLALALAGSAGWPSQRFGSVLATCVAITVAYTVYSEYLNVVVRRAWAYSDLMPILPGSGTGLLPFVQWIVLSPGALAWARHAGKAAEIHRVRLTDLGSGHP